MARPLILSRPIRRVEVTPPPGVRGWPWAIPAVAQLSREGLDLPQALVLTGENGVGKSTIVEAIAEAYGLNAEGGSTGARHVTHRSESPLADAVSLIRGAGASKWGFFVRAETMHSFFTYLAHDAQAVPGVVDDSFHRRSHGESFLDLIDDRFFTPNGPRPGLYVLDEPESALSFSSALALLGRLKLLLESDRTQVILSTHSPVLAALPGASVLRLDAAGYAPTPWADLESVIGLRAFLADPGRFLSRIDA